MNSLNLFEELLEEASAVIEFPAAAAGGSGSGSDDFHRELIAKCLRKLLSKDRLAEFKKLVYLLALVERCQLDAYQVLFLTPPRTHAFKHLLVEPCRQQLPVLSPTDKGVEIQLDKGETFTCYFSNMPESIVCANLYAEFLGFEELQRLIENTRLAGLRASALDEAAIAAAEAFDVFRRSRGGSSHEGKQFQSIIDFLETIFPKKNFSFGDIHSELPLQYWKDNALDPAPGLQRYQSVHECFVDFVCEFAELSAARSARRANSVDAMFDEHGIDIDENDVENQHTHLFEDWQALWREFPELKFLKSKQLSAVESQTDLPPPAIGLRTSALRSDCYRGYENRLVEARRRASAPKHRREILDELQSKGPNPSWDEAAQTFVEVYGAFRDAVYATTYQLLANKKTEGIRLLYAVEDSLGGYAGYRQILTELDIATETDHFDENVFAATATALMDRFEQGCNIPEPLSGVLKTCATASRRLNQGGFRRSHKHDTETVEQMEQASNRLPNALRHLQHTHRDILTTLAAISSDQRQRDLETMHSVLAQVYAGETQRATP